MKEVTLPVGVTKLPEECFRATGLEDYTIPSQITEIGVQAFYACKYLSTLKLNEGLTTICDRAFFGCPLLLDVTIPATVTSIGAAAFYGCEDRTAVYFLNKNCTIGISSFSMQSPDFVIYGDPGGQLQEDCKTLVYKFYCIGTHDMQGMKTEIEADVKTGDGLRANHCSLCDYAETEIIPWPNPFEDVAAGSWYYAYVKDCYVNELFSGTTETTFEPNVKMTRAMFCRTLANLSGEDLSAYTSAPFTDVKNGLWYTAAVAWAADDERKIVNGKGDGTFAPNATITRQEICVMLYSYADYQLLTLKTEDNGVVFADQSTIASWAAKAVAAMKNSGVINGKPSGDVVNFDPLGTASRAEGAVILSLFSKIK